MKLIINISNFNPFRPTKQDMLHNELQWDIYLYNKTDVSILGNKLFMEEMISGEGCCNQRLVGANWL